MNLARFAIFAALMLSIAAQPATAEYVANEWDDGDIGGWQGITVDNDLAVMASGGVSDSGFLHSYQTAPTFGISGAIQRFEPYIGDYGARGYVAVRCYLKFFAGTFTAADFRVRYQDSGHNGWYLPLTADFTPGAWQNLAFEFDPQWSDGEAMAAGWVQESATPTFQETMASVYTAEIRIQGSGDLEVGIDNFQLDDDLVAVEAASWGRVKGLFR